MLRLFGLVWKFMNTSMNPPGLGAGAGATLFGELARISTKKERTMVFSLFITVRQLGLILGKFSETC